MVPSGLRVLVVAGSPGEATELSRLLATHDVEVQAVATLGDALAVEGRVDVALVDLDLADSGPTETLHRFRATRPDCPVVVAGIDDDAMVRQALHDGAQDYLARGELDAETVRRAIRYAIERHQLMRALEASRDDLARAVAERDEILATATHDLRSPLTTLLGVTATLRTRDVTDEQREQLLAIVERQTNRLEELVGDLLELSRSRHAAARAEMHDVQLDVVVAQALLDAHVAPRDLDLDVEPLRLMTDPSRLRRVIVNLVENAAKYGAPPIEVAGHKGPEGGIELTVRDHGGGIPDDFAPHVFEPFSRAAGDRVAGTGLGLAIVERLVAMLGGRVSYEPADPGARFRVWLPAEVGIPG
jgi:phosphoserine phosphatase RsbU/P